MDLFSKDSLTGFAIGVVPNLILIRWGLYTLTARIKEIVSAQGEKIEEDFSKQLAETRKDFNQKFIEQRDKIGQNSEEIVRLKTQREGIDNWLKELSERMDIGFREIGNKLDSHIERSHR